MKELLFNFKIIEKHLSRLKLKNKNDIILNRMKEAYLYQKLPEKKVQCRTCAHFCVLEPEQWGRCGVRKNIEGKLYALNYGKVVALNIDPIEKKPLYHFLPGTFSLSLATVGCNFRCLY
jgi:pyruvate formate lyase activating enzyme